MAKSLSWACKGLTEKFVADIYERLHFVVRLLVRARGSVFFMTFSKYYCFFDIVHSVTDTD